MSSVAALSPRGRWLLAAAHVPLLLAPILLTVFLADVPAGIDPVGAALLAVAVCLLQLRHALAAAHGVRPSGWPVTLLALAALVYLPLLWFPETWITTQWALVASLVMLVPRPAGPALAVALVVGAETVLAVRVVELYDLGPAVVSWVVFYNLTLSAVGPIALLVAARLVRVLDAHSAARTQLADAVLRRDRLRISRDLHDVLGQNLAAVSLKGELAARLWESDRPAALAQVRELTRVARAALRDVSAVTFDRHPTSVRGELDNAAGLLRAGGIEPRIEVTLPEAPRVQDDALGWVIREGVTNVLHHSSATEVTVRAGQQDGWIRLEIVNNNAHAGGPLGSGLDGLTGRLRPLGGVLTAGALPGQRFRLAVDIPEELP